uniref:Uncharacterized protein n=1 Tax=Fagus sylvatica TaxID=28930 RepID=A0A2N9FG32_FAGSY
MVVGLGGVSTAPLAWVAGFGLPPAWVWVWPWVAGLGLPPAWVWVWPWVAGLGLPPAWVGFGRGLLGWVWEGMGGAGEDGYGVRWGWVG